MPSDQLPPADELFDVRDKIKQLTSRERELKAIVIADPSTRTGNHYAVEVKDVATARMDVKELRNMHPEIAEQFTHTVFDKRVELRGINEDGELTSLRRKPEKATQ
jgi:predicted phage-related endonuclease